MSNAVIRRGLLDTPVVLAIQVGDADATRFALEMLKTTLLDMSEFSVMVLLVASLDAAEHSGRQSFLRHNRVHRITARISRRAFALLCSLPPPTPLTADDAIIAATAIEQSLPLYTLDPARFANVPGLTTLQPY